MEIQAAQEGKTSEVQTHQSKSDNLTLLKQHKVSPDVKLPLTPSGCSPSSFPSLLCASDTSESEHCICV